MPAEDPRAGRTTGASTGGLAPVCFEPAPEVDPERCATGADHCLAESVSCICPALAHQGGVDGVFVGLVGLGARTWRQCGGRGLRDPDRIEGIPAAGGTAATGAGVCWVSPPGGAHDAGAPITMRAPASV